MTNKFKTFTYTFCGTDFSYDVSYYECAKEYMSEYMRCFELEEDEHKEKVEQIMELLKNVDYTKFVDHNEDAIKDMFEEEAENFFEENFFVCSECGCCCELCDESAYEDGVCRKCCPESRDEDAYWDNYNREVDLYMEDRYDD